MEQGTVLEVWAAAAPPMGSSPGRSLHSWPTSFPGPRALSPALILSPTAGLMWQLFLVVSRLTDGTRFAHSHAETTVNKGRPRLTTREAPSAPTSTYTPASLPRAPTECGAIPIPNGEVTTHPLPATPTTPAT